MDPERHRDLKRQIQRMSVSTVELTFLSVEGDVDLKESFENHFEGSAVCVFPKIMTSSLILRAPKFSDLLTDKFLNFWSGISFVRRKHSNMETSSAS